MEPVQPAGRRPVQRNVSFKQGAGGCHPQPYPIDKIPALIWMQIRAGLDSSYMAGPDSYKSGARASLLRGLASVYHSVYSSTTTSPTFPNRREGSRYGADDSTSGGSHVGERPGRPPPHPGRYT